MKVKVFEFNPIAVNTYVLHDKGECVVIDAACFFPDEQSALLNYILDNNLVVKHILNTHLHFDHIFGVNFMESHFKLQMEANKADEFLLDGIDSQMAMFGFKSNGQYTPTFGKYIDENDVIEFGDQKLSIFHVPGHSPGSIAFYNEAENVVFSGDVLFNGSIGRTDLPKGNHEQLLESIRKNIFTLPGKTIVYPGHGPATTVENEINSNPFF